MVICHSFLYVYQKVNLAQWFDNSHQYLGIPKCPREILCIPPQSIVSWLWICPFTSSNHTSIYHEHPWTSIHIHQHSSTSQKEKNIFVPLFTKKNVWTSMMVDECLVHHCSPCWWMNVIHQHPIVHQKKTNPFHLSLYIYMCVCKYLFIYMTDPPTAPKKLGKPHRRLRQKPRATLQEGWDVMLTFPKP